MSKKINNDDLDPHQERLLREMVSKEMMKKIEHRIAGDDSSAMKSFRALFDEKTEKKNRMENKIKNILKEKHQKENDDDTE